jgi:Ca-activated chloride channel homolog
MNSPLDLPPDPRQQRRQKRLAWTMVLLALACTLAGGVIYGGRLAAGWLGDRIGSTSSGRSSESEAVDLVIAVSPGMKPTFDQLVNAFNERALTASTTGERPATLPIRTLELAPDKMVEQGTDSSPPFQALAPDSSLWLHQLEQRWAEITETSSGDSIIPIAIQRTSTPVRYATSPIVIVAWESVARELSWPYEPIGWQQIQRRATEDPNFKWNHPSTNNASGLLATLAEFYAGAGLTRGLTEEAATAPSTLEYVRAVEATIRFYGEGEAVILQRLRNEGRAFLDAFVAQEQIVIAWNQSRPTERLVAIYPAEGTLWADHPLALLELENLSKAQRNTYQQFTTFLLGEEAQSTLLSTGYRPADLSLSLAELDSPFAPASQGSGEESRPAVDWRQPQTTLQMPSRQVVEVVQNVWWYTKRPTNVFLVVDTSGSMQEGGRMESTKTALLAFIDNIRGDRDQVGLIEFGTGIKRLEPLRPLNDEGRAYYRQVIRAMTPSGRTALLDAVWEAHQQILTTGDTEAINAIVVMTDGLENASRHTARDLQRAFQDTGAQRIVIFTIGFGADADVKLLQEIAAAGQGQFKLADETDIEELYRIISTYF